jgi:DNA-binding MarR family transcriptional regulator
VATEAQSQDLDEAVGFSRGSLDNCVGPAVRVVRNLLVARSGSAHAEFGLKPGAFSMLALITANPGCSQIDLAREADMDKSAVVLVLDDLQARGLIRRERSGADRRRHQLLITAEGQRQFEAMEPATALIEAPLREEFSGAEMTQLLDLLERARRALQSQPLTRPG